jgi:hypothetical protein
MVASLRGHFRFASCDQSRVRRSAARGLVRIIPEASRRGTRLGRRLPIEMAGIPRTNDFPLTAH